MWIRRPVLCSTHIQTNMLLYAAQIAKTHRQNYTWRWERFKLRAIMMLRHVITQMSHILGRRNDLYNHKSLNLHDKIKSSHRFTIAKSTAHHHMVTLSQHSIACYAPRSEANASIILFSSVSPSGGGPQSASSNNCLHCRRLMLACCSECSFSEAVLANGPCRSGDTNTMKRSVVSSSAR